MEGAQVGTIELSDSIFAVPVNEHLVHQAVVAQLANKRQGTQKAKTRSEVRGGGRKPWRQKGTGHARQGSIRAPQWTGGGVVFAPTPRDYSVKMNKKEKQLAMKSVLTSKVNESKFIVLDELKLAEIKTKQIKAVLDNLKVEKALIVTKEKDDVVVKSANNLPKVATTALNNINVYDILKYIQLLYKRGSCSNRGGIRIMADLKYYDVILKPVVTEKSMTAMGEKKYTFYVNPDATKTQVKEAVERMFEGAKVAKVNTMNLNGKKKRRGMVYGRTAAKKKAIVQLTQDSADIQIFEGL